MQTLLHEFYSQGPLLRDFEHIPVTMKATRMAPFTDTRVSRFIMDSKKILPNVGTLISPTRSAFIDLNDIPSDRRTCDFCGEVYSTSGAMYNYPVRLPVSHGPILPSLPSLTLVPVCQLPLLNRC